MSYELYEVIAEWFAKSQIHLGVPANIPKKQSKAKKLFYTWRDCFAENIRDIWASNLIKQSIDLKSRAHSVQGKIPRYNAMKKAFANEIFLHTKNAGIII